MGETPDEIKQEIEEARSRLDQDFNRLEYRVKATADWRAQFHRHPWFFLGAAFTGALLVSLMVFGPRRA